MHGTSPRTVREEQKVDSSVQGLSLVEASITKGLMLVLEPRNTHILSPLRIIFPWHRSHEQIASNHERRIILHVENRSRFFGSRQGLNIDIILCDHLALHSPIIDAFLSRGISRNKIGC